jgi:hypothetical protein
MLVILFIINVALTAPIPSKSKESTTCILKFVKSTGMLTTRNGEFHGIADAVEYCLGNPWLCCGGEAEKTWSQWLLNVIWKVDDAIIIISFMIWILLTLYRY